MPRQVAQTDNVENNEETCSRTRSRALNGGVSDRKKGGREMRSFISTTRDTSGIWPATGLLLRALCVYSAVASSQGLIQADQEYLTTFYADLGGDNWVNNANWTDADSIGWGVTLQTDDNGTEHVVGIVLDDNNLVGTIPDVGAGQLEHLERLHLMRNSISGSLPAGLENLLAMKFFELGQNLLTGSIPPELGSLPLVRLYLYENEFSGEIPAELGNASTLLLLLLQTNDFGGQIPGALGKLSGLEKLDLAQNTNLTGPIPPQFGDLVTLTHLFLDECSLTEDIPAELGVLAQAGQLVEVDLGDNFLTGVVPVGLEEVEDLDLDGNFIEGYEQRDGGVAALDPTTTTAPSPAQAPMTAPVTATTPHPTPTPTHIPTVSDDDSAATPYPTPTTWPAQASAPATVLDPSPDDADSGAGSDDGTDTGAIVGAVLATALGSAMIAAGWCCWARRKAKGRQASSGGSPAGGDRAEIKSAVVSSSSATNIDRGGEIRVDSAASPSEQRRPLYLPGSPGGVASAPACDGYGNPPEGLRPRPSLGDTAGPADTLSLPEETLCRTIDPEKIPGSFTPSKVSLDPHVGGGQGHSGGGRGTSAGAAPSRTDLIPPTLQGALPGIASRAFRPPPEEAKEGFPNTFDGFPPFPPGLRHTKSAAAGTTIGRRTTTGGALGSVGGSGSARNRSLDVPLVRRVLPAGHKGAPEYNDLPPPPDTESDLVASAQNDTHPDHFLGNPSGTVAARAAESPSPFCQPGSAPRKHGGGDPQRGGRGEAAASSKTRLSRKSGGNGSARVDSILEVARGASVAAQQSSIVGVPEVARLVETLVNLSDDYRTNQEAFEKIGNLCSNLTEVLGIVKELLTKDPRLDVGRTILEPVEEKVRTVVEVMKAYQGASRTKRMWQASFYRRRVDEAEAAVRLTLDYLNTTLQACSLRKMDDVSQSLAKMANSPSTRRKHHRQNLIESEQIPEGTIEISDLMIGSGGTSNVFMAHYAGDNVAAKVVTVRGDDPGEAENRRKSFLAEVRNMRRLNNSPRVVRVFGIITWRPGELVLVMKYMAGGDLFSFIKKHRDRGEEIDDKLTRSLIVDAAEGMKYLHQHKTWHGDLKSLNVLLDAHNHAYISDFGTSHWTEETRSKVLQSKTPGAGGMNHLTIHWAAPEVLENPFGVPSFMSDVYSFGIIVWEVLSRKVPWAGLSGREMRVKVCIECTGPPMPPSAPPDLAELARACWRYEPEHRPTFGGIVEHLNGEDAREARRGSGLGSLSRR